MTQKRTQLYKNYKIVVKFLYDSIMRFPSEVYKLKVKNIFVNEKGDVCVNVSSDVGTKTKQSVRNFNLLYCGEIIKKYISENNLKPEDPLFPCIHSSHLVNKFNKKLKGVAVKLWGDTLSHPIAGQTFGQISGYDFRHSGAIHLRKIASETGAISIDKILIRGGWADFEMLNYYTKFLGLDGIIDKDVMLNIEDRTHMQIKIEKQEKELRNQKKELEDLKNLILHGNEEDEERYILTNDDSPSQELEIFPKGKFKTKISKIWKNPSEIKNVSIADEDDYKIT